VVLVIEQLSPKPLLLLIAAVGALPSKVVVAFAVDVQPFKPVTVTVNVPAALTVAAAVVAPFDHK
jgi:hypothetical protein